MNPYEKLICARLARIPKGMSFEQEAEWLKQEGLESFIPYLTKNPKKRKKLKK